MVKCFEDLFWVDKGVIVKQKRKTTGGTKTKYPIADRREPVNELKQQIKELDEQKYVYQLKLTGTCGTTDCRYEKISTTVFLSSESAEKRIQKMIDMCSDETYLSFVKKETAKIEIIKLEIIKD